MEDTRLIRITRFYKSFDDMIVSEVVAFHVSDISIEQIVKHEVFSRVDAIECKITLVFALMGRSRGGREGTGVRTPP